jgi:hypothetical protein
MYATCIFCHSALGANEAIEHFPVGRRLAFDAAKGRLWVVCRICERWNLSPLDDRWEAVEECEREFRATKLRVSTPNIGLARVREGTTLVRIGDPLRPEMAAWRYGDQFNRRRRSFYALTAGASVAVVGSLAAQTLLSSTVVAIGFAPTIVNWTMVWHQRRTMARVSAKGKVFKLSPAMVDGVVLHPNEAQGFALEVPHKFAGPAPADTRRRLLRIVPRFIPLRERPHVMLHGDQAMAAARIILPHVNRAGATSRQVLGAVTVLEGARGPEQLLGHTAFVNRGIRISMLPAEVRLALEMSLHEEDERRALEGELSILEDRWREAEEVAAISDDMFLPQGITAMLANLKNDR